MCSLTSRTRVRIPDGASSCFQRTPSDSEGSGSRKCDTGFEPYQSRVANGRERASLVSVRIPDGASNPVVFLRFWLARHRSDHQMLRPSQFEGFTHSHAVLRFPTFATNGTRRNNQSSRRSRAITGVGHCE
jgi:hypothetical protein